MSKPDTMFAIFLLVVSSTLVEGTYVVSFPNSLLPGIPLTIRVHTSGTSGSNVTVVASLKYAQNDTVVQKTSSSVTNGTPKTIDLNVPDNLMPSQYKISVTGSGGLSFHNESKIHYEEESLFVLIQTDKSRYSAGQLVRFRAAFILPNLLNYQGNATITIQDGKGNKIEVIGPQQVTDGVMSGKLQLSNEPVFGEWEVIADARGTTSSKVIEVYDYILPKFLVDIKLPDIIKTTQASLPVDIKARFTFNTAVLGNCTILIYNDKKSWHNMEFSKEIQGTVRFTIPMSQFTQSLDVHSKINIRATVTDHATALSMVTERELKLTFDKVLPRLTINKVDYKDSFIPGMTYETNVFIGQGDKPLGKKGILYVSYVYAVSEYKVCNSGKSSPYRWLDVTYTHGTGPTIAFDESGFAKLSLNVSSKAEDLTVELLYNETSQHAHGKLHLFAVSNDDLTLLQLFSERVKANVGEQIPLEISSTHALDGYLVFEIYARGMLLNTETISVKQENHKQHSMVATQDMIPQVYILLSHLTTTGKLISDYVTLNVSGNPLKNKINVTYSKTQLKPGENMTMKITADPHSKVYVMVEDERNRILGTGNDIFPEEIIGMVVNASHDIYENIYDNKIITNKKRSLRYNHKITEIMQEEKNNRVTKDQQPVKRAHGVLGDLDDVYIESGLIILTNAEVFEKVDKHDLQMYDSGIPHMCPLAPIAALEMTTPTVQPGILPGHLPGLLLEDVMRSKFPETWIWDEYDVGAPGTLAIEQPVPDSITSWVTSVFATNPNTGFGITDTKTQFTVKKSFFVTTDLPSSIVHGEEFLVQLSVFNYMASKQRVVLETVLSDDPQNTIPAETEVKAGQGHSTYIHVTPKSIGTLTITVMAKAGPLFAATVASDSLTKNVTVKPHGVHRMTNEQHLIDVKNGGTPFTKTILLNDPKDMVPGTKNMLLSITGNFMVQSVDGLQNLLRMPYGCGEQTMLNFAPAIYITKYLKTVGKLTSNIQTKAEGGLKTGLQRELTYQHHDGSFSAFGDRDPSGSSWLTAFVVKCFHQADGLIKIDDVVMSKAMTWLLRYQHSDGSFYEPGRIIHTQMQAGTASGVKLTAFILISVLENRHIKGVEVAKINNAISKGKTYLERHINSAHDVYALAILCYALANAGSSSGSTCFTKLKNAALLDGDKMFWTANTVISKRALTTRAPSADIEASSYALLAYLKLGKGSEAFPIVKWLVSQRNPSGGFQSTQDTVISLQALSEFSARYASGPSQNYGVQFNAFGSNFAHSYSTSTSTYDVVHSKELPSALTNVILQAIGEGTAVIDISMSYYISGNRPDNHIAVSVTILKETLNSVTVKPCISWTGPATSGMLVAEVEMPTGFRPDNDALKAEKLIKRHETNGRNIALYFDGINRNGRVCVDVKMDRADPVVKSQACHLTAYDYYEPTHQAMERYEFGLLKNATICSVCPLCRFCNGGVGQIGVGK